MPQTYPINLTFREHQAVLQLLHNIITDAQQGSVDEPESLPLYDSVYRKYHKAFDTTDMFQNL